MLPNLLIFDFDGVIADSEILACNIAAVYAAELGARIRPDEGLALFQGKRIEDVAAIIQKRGGNIPKKVSDNLLERTMQGFALDLQPIPGVKTFLESHLNVPRCIASSSSHRRLVFCLDHLGLTDYFPKSRF